MASHFSPEDRIAQERGRLLAAQAIANSPEQMKRVIDAIGMEAAKERWPEAFRSPSTFGRILDRIRFSLLGSQ